MKTPASDSLTRQRAGMVTIVFLILLAIMMILVMAEARALIQLRRETKFLEQQQIKRLNTVMSQSARP